MATTTRGRAGPGWSLGVRVPDYGAVHDACLRGLPYSSFGSLAKTLGVSQAALTEATAISPSTLSRRKGRGRFTPDESEHLFRVAVLFEKAAELFAGDTAAAAQWLTTPRPALGGRTPLALARTQFGARMVEDLIGRLEHGVFT